MWLSVQDASIDVYIAAFRARCDAVRRPGRPEVDEPGVEGLLSWADDPLARLVVTDDRAYDVLGALLPGVRAGMITAFPAAQRCVSLIAGHGSWRITTAGAMLSGDLRDVPAVALPSDLALRPVRRLAGAAPDGVPLGDAVAAAMDADPGIEAEPREFADYLRSLPRAIGLLAAVDRDGSVRATAGSGTFGTYATVMFVNTDPRWRRRGIGRAMTAAALHAARETGARRACLDASDAGRRIYLRLGFEDIAPVTRFFRGARRRAAHRAAPDRGS